MHIVLFKHLKCITIVVKLILFSVKLTLNIYFHKINSEPLFYNLDVPTSKRIVVFFLRRYFYLPLISLQ